MNFLDRFLPRVEFESYDDFKQNYKLNIPENFNFAYDIIDEYARLVPEKKALNTYLQARNTEVLPEALSPTSRFIPRLNVMSCSEKHLKFVILILFIAVLFTYKIYFTLQK